LVALRNVGPLDHVAKFTFVQAWLQTVAQRHHAAIAEMRPDAQPIDFLG